MKYLCLAYESEQVLNALSQEEWQALRQETLDYVDSLRSQGYLVDTRPLQSARTASTVQVRSGELVVTDGPFAETKEQIGGYFLLEAADFDQALRLASQWPSARLGTIEVRPIEDGLAMERRYR
ncbi:MAG: YciI family protein [Pseudomonadales bacterium]|nr:YciI family protein [Pseudomonadales bacterium]